MPKIWSAVAPRMRELQAYDRRFAAPGNILVFFEQCRSQLREAVLRAFRNHELVRIGTSRMTNGHRFPAPDQARSAPSEMSPSPDRVFRRISVSSSVPTFHRLHRDPVGNCQSSACYCLPKRGIWSTYNFLVAGNRQTKGPHMLPKTIHTLQARQAHDGFHRHADSLAFGNAITAAAPSNAMTTKATQPF